MQTLVVNELRSKRVAPEIPAMLLAKRAGINRSRLSSLERGYAEPTGTELQRLADALEQLIEAKAVIQRTAAAVGWLGGGGG